MGIILENLYNYSPNVFFGCSNPSLVLWVHYVCAILEYLQNWSPNLVFGYSNPVLVYKVPYMGAIPI